MTKLRPNKPVIRETDVRHDGDPIVVELHQRHLTLRVKGKHGREFSYDFLLRNAERLGRAK